MKVPGGMYTNTGCLYVRSESTIMAPNLSTSPYMSLVPPTIMWLITMIVVRVKYSRCYRSDLLALEDVSRGRGMGCLKYNDRIIDAWPIELHCGSKYSSILLLCCRAFHNDIVLWCIVLHCAVFTWKSSPIGEDDQRKILSSVEILDGLGSLVSGIWVPYLAGLRLDGLIWYVKKGEKVNLSINASSRGWRECEWIWWAVLSR